MKSIALATGVVALLVAIGALSAESPVPPTPSPEVLRDIAKIQEQLGGSIVEGSELDALAPPASESPDGLPEADSPEAVDVLRGAVWELEKTAHKLEMANLYRHADKLRSMAAEFRQEARDLKPAAEKPE